MEMLMIPAWIYPSLSRMCFEPGIAGEPLLIP